MGQFKVADIIFRVHPLEFKMTIRGHRSRMLPQQVRRDRIRFPLDLVRHTKWIAGNSEEVVAHADGGNDQHRALRRNNLADKNAPPRSLPAENPDKNSHGNRQTENHSFIRPAIRQDREPHGHNDSIAAPVRRSDSRPSAQNHRSAYCSRCASPVTVGPVAERRKPQNRQHPAEQRPLLRYPALQDPGDGRAH